MSETAAAAGTPRRGVRHEGVVAFVGLAIVWQIASYFFPHYLFPPVGENRRIEYDRISQPRS